MTNLEKDIFEGLKRCVEEYSEEYKDYMRRITFAMASKTTRDAEEYKDYMRVKCLINHYENNIGKYKNLIETDGVSDPAEIVKNDYCNLELICFKAEEKLDMKEVGEWTKDPKIYFSEDDVNGLKYLYSFDCPLPAHLMRHYFLEKEVNEEYEF